MDAVNRMGALILEILEVWQKNGTFKLSKLFIIVITVVSLHQGLCWWSS